MALQRFVTGVGITLGKERKDRQQQQQQQCLQGPSKPEGKWEKNNVADPPGFRDTLDPLSADVGRPHSATFSDGEDAPSCQGILNETCVTLPCSPIPPTRSLLYKRHTMILFTPVHPIFPSSHAHHLSPFAFQASIQTLHPPRGPGPCFDYFFVSCLALFFSSFDLTSYATGRQVRIYPSESQRLVPHRVFIY